MHDRISTFRNKMKDKKLDCAIIFNPLNYFYFSGFTGDFGCLIITSSNIILITDSRYTEQAKQETNFEVIESGEDIFETIKGVIDTNKINTIGIEEKYITYSQYKRLSEKVAAEIVSLEGAIEDLRKIKDTGEIENIRKAAKLGDKAFSYILDFVKPGISEKEIAVELEYFLKKNGAQSISFDPIVASGIRSSLPHAQPTDKKIGIGDFVVLDFGCKINGYCSDMTRTVVVGKANDEQKKIYNIVLEAQNRALEFISKGKIASEVDKVARDYISKMGYKQNFKHSLGHGVGLNVHEAPKISFASNEELQVGMVVTIEPGIYTKRFGGVRIEDMVIIKDNDIENLVKSPKSLIEL